LVVIACAIFFAIFRAVPTHTWRSLELQSPWGTSIGLVILLGSTVFTLWARFALGTMWTLDAVVKEGHALRTDGPYGITRHPIYTGDFTSAGSGPSVRRPREADGLPREDPSPIGAG